MKKWLSLVKVKAKEKGITNEDIAGHFDITPGQVSHWFTGRRKIWLHEYIELCRYILEDPNKMLSLDKGVEEAPKVIDKQDQIIERLDLIIMGSHPERSPNHGKLMKHMRKTNRSRASAAERKKTRSRT